jgi:co-chaperonin GroES (HSP10)
MNDHIMVKEIKREEADAATSLGLFIPKETLEDEQVSQGKVIRSNSANVAVGDTLLFHRVMPVDVNMKLEGDDKLETYFFIKEKDIICKITT